MKKNGFTLIELLAVIIILGILMLIAIPSVTAYINNSRKDAYVDSIKEITKGAVILVNSGELNVNDPDTTYYIPVDAISTENGVFKSPYGDIDEAYVIVTYNGDDFNYYFLGKDETDIGIDKPTEDEKIDKDKIVSNIDVINTGIGIGDREKIIIYNSDLTIKENKTSVDNIPEGDITYPEGKNKKTVVTGDIVKIGTEEFYVVKRNGNDLYLLAKYNLKVGGFYNSDYTKTGEYIESDSGYGLQSSEATGWIKDASSFKGSVSFSNSNYWNGKVGTEYPGVYCDSATYTSGTVCSYIYYDTNKNIDSNNTISTYIREYKSKLIAMGVSIKDARLMSVEEAYELGCGNGEWWCRHDTANAPEWVSSTSYWLGSAYDYEYAWGIFSNNAFDGYPYDDAGSFGVRPLIII